MRKDSWQLKLSGTVHHERPHAPHSRQQHRPENVRERLLPAFDPLPLHAHPGRGRGQGFFVPFQQHQIGPPGIVPAGREEL